MSAPKPKLTISIDPGDSGIWDLYQRLANDLRSVMANYTHNSSVLVTVETLVTKTVQTSYIGYYE